MLPSFLSSHTASWESVFRHGQAFLASCPPPSTERQVGPPSSTSVWSPKQQQQQWRWRRRRRQHYRPAGWAVRAANYIRRCRQRQLWFLSLTGRTRSTALGLCMIAEYVSNTQICDSSSSDTHCDEVALSKHMVIQSSSLHNHHRHQCKTHRHWITGIWVLGNKRSRRKVCR